MDLIKKIFIKNYKNTKDSNVRFKYGIVASCFGIATNFLLFIGKLIIGILSGSIAIISDAINNLTDGSSSLISYFGFKLSSKPADRTHPFGHARYEYITSLIVAIIILVVGVLLCKESITKIFSPSNLNVSNAVFIILAIAILIKIFQLILYLNFGKAIQSEVLKANAIDSRNDIITTLAVLISSIIMRVLNINIDAYIGVAVSLFIIFSSIILVKDAFNPLLGTVPSKELVHKIKKEIRSFDGVLGIHELILHSYGKDKYFASVHVEVSSDTSPIDAHDLIDNIEEYILNTLQIVLVIHTDPVQNNDKETETLKKKVTEAIKKYNIDLSIHDFRIVKGKTHINCVFDIVSPIESKIDINNLKSFLISHFSKEKIKLNFVFNLEHDYTE